MILLNQVYLANDLMNWVHWSKYFCMLIVMEFAFHLWHLNPRGPMQYYLARVFRINSLWEKWSQNRIFFFILKNFLNYFCWKRSLKNWYCLEFNLLGHDLGFTTRCEFPRLNSLSRQQRVQAWKFKPCCESQIMNQYPFTITERIKNRFINGSVTFK